MASKKKTATGGQRLNRELLERARQQARAIDEELAAEEEAVPVEDAVPAPSRREPVRSTSGASRRASTAKRLREKNEENRRKTMSAEEISERLANPTKFVPESELRAQYGFVLRDLRNMAVLAGASFLVLTVLAVLLPG